MFGGGAGMGSIGSMLGPMIGGAAGSMFQPGSKAKDEATETLNQRLSGWDQYLASVQAGTAMMHAQQQQQITQPNLAAGISTGLGNPMTM